ncbi:hypothetical protein [Paraconexibacter sp. AEG42_29]
MTVLYHETTQQPTVDVPGGPALPGRVPVAPAGPDERAARAALRGQIARLERDLADTLIEAFGRDRFAVDVAARVRGPRLLDLGELELIRDDLAARLHGARVTVAQRGAEYAERRALLERMLREPERHKYVRVTLKELGEPGCGVYQVRPRVGIIGMLAGWWHVKLSSGCPLATG